MKVEKSKANVGRVEKSNKRVRSFGCLTQSHFIPFNRHCIDRYSLHLSFDTTMPRAGQVARRKAKAAQAEESDSDEYYMDETQGQGAQGGRGGGKRKLRVLPVAEIEDDWDGEPEDGATYLALVK